MNYFSIALPSPSRRTLLAAMLASACGSAFAANGTAYAVVTEPVGSDRLAQLAPQFDAWKKAGLITGVKLLRAQPGQKEQGFSNLAVVHLPSEKAYKTWRADMQARLGEGAIVRQADLLQQEGKPSATPAQAVHVASLYATHVSAQAYKIYTEGYITPNMNLQQASGIMSQYSMYIERDPVGGKVRSLLVMEYADEAAYARRETVKAEGKKKLSANAEWKRIDGIKETIRTDISSTATNAIGPVGAAH